MRQRSIRIGAVTLALLGAGSACTEPSNTVTVVVTLDGNPIEGIAVRFQSLDEALLPDTEGTTNQAGEFVKTILPGERFRITITPPPNSVCTPDSFTTSSFNEKSQVFTFECTSQRPVASVDVTPQQYGAFSGLGGSWQFTPTAKDAQGQSLDREISCSVTPLGAGVTTTSGCLVTIATQATMGDYTLNAVSEGVVGTGEINVAPPPTGEAVLVGQVGANDQLFLWNFGTNTITQIGNNVGLVLGFDVDPVLRQVIFGSGPGAQGDIFKINLDGSGLTNLTNSAAALNRHPARNPIDGDIFFSSGPNIWKMKSDGTLSQQITTANAGDNRVTISPDGTTLAFARAIAGNSEIHIANMDGSNIVQVTNFPGFDGEPDYIAQIPVVSEPFVPTWTRNVGNNFDIFLFDNVPVGNAINLTEAPSNESSPRRGCAPNTVTFISDRGGRPRPWMMEDFLRSKFLDLRPPPSHSNVSFTAFKLVCPSEAPPPPPPPPPPPADFAVTYSLLSWLHVAFGGGPSFTCAAGRAEVLAPGPANLVLASALAGSSYTMTWSGPGIVGPSSRSGTLDSNAQFLDRQAISSFGTYSVTVSVTSDGITRTANGTVTVTSGSGSCPAP